MTKETGRKQTMSVVRIAYDALLAALVVVLGYYAIDLGNNKITLESLPVLMGALMFGPIDGMLIGGVGNFIYQILKYGFSVTTVLWILPHIIQGLLVGLYAKKRGFRPKRSECIIVVLLSELLTTVLNTGVIAADALIFGYYTKAYVFGSLVVRIVTCVVKGIIYGALLPELIKLLRKAGIRGTGDTE